MNNRQSSQPKFYKKKERPYNPKLTSSQDLFKDKCTLSVFADFDEPSTQRKSTSMSTTIVKAPVRRSNLKVVLVQSPKGKHQSSTIQWADYIRSDPGIIKGIVLSLASRIQLFQRRRIFYPDAFLVKGSAQGFIQNEQLLSNIDNKPEITKKVEDLVASQQTFKDFIKGMRKKHDQAYELYKQFEGDLIQKEFQMQMKELNQSFMRKKTKPQKNDQLEIEVQKLCTRQNTRLLLYLMCSFVGIIRRNTMPLLDFVKYYYWLLSNPKERPDIAKIQEYLKKAFDRQQSLLTKQHQYILTNSTKQVQIIQQRVVEAKPLTQRDQVGPSYAHYQLLISPNQSCMLLKETQPSQSWDEPSKYFFKNRLVKVLMNEHQVRIKKIQNNIRLNIIHHIYKTSLKENACKNNICRYEVKNVKKDQEGFIIEFDYKVQIGQQQFSEHFRRSIGKLNVSHLYHQGKQKVVSFFISICQGLTELQELGIYHADLHVNNCIQFKNIFQIIDFNFALMCNINSPEWKNFENLTKCAIEDWLKNPRSSFELLFERYARLENIRNAYRQGRFDLVQAIDLCILSLQKLLVQGHRRQFVSLINQIVDYGADIPESQRFTQAQGLSIKKLAEQYIKPPEKPLYSRFKFQLMRLFQAKDGREVELASQYVSESMLYQQRQQQLRKIIHVNKILSSKKLERISRPYFDESFIVREDHQIIDYKITHRDDSHSISSKQQILDEGKIYIYQFIIKLIKAVQELQFRQIYHSQLSLPCFVRKSKSFELRHMHKAQFLGTGMQDIQYNLQNKGQNKKKLIETSSLIIYEKRQISSQSHEFGRIHHLIKQAKQSHMSQVVRIIRDLINFQHGYTDKKGESYGVFLRTERQEIEAKLKELAPQNGYKRLYEYCKRARLNLMSKLIIYKN